MRGWASLSPSKPPPETLTVAASAALAFVREHGFLRVSGSWRDGEARIALNDPAGIVARLEVWAEGADGSRTRLTRTSDAPDGHHLYRVDSKKEIRLVAQAIFKGTTRRVVVAELMLGDFGIEPPPAPDPEVMAAKLAPSPPALEPSSDASEPVRWWWVLAGVAAAAFAGIAVVQDAR